jgi:hypothetical protein
LVSFLRESRKLNWSSTIYNKARTLKTSPKSYNKRNGNWMTCLKKRKCGGVKGLRLSGSLIEIKIRSFSIKKLAKDEGRIQLTA